MYESIKLQEKLNQQLLNAIWEEKISEVSELIKKGADVNCFNEDWDTPLHLAAHEGYTDIVRLLLQKRAFTNRLNIDGEMPLHLAASQMDIETVELLIQAGTEVGPILSQDPLIELCLSQENASLWTKMLLMGLNTRVDPEIDSLDEIEDQGLRNEVKAKRADIEEKCKRIDLKIDDLPLALQILFHCFNRIQAFEENKKLDEDLFFVRTHKYTTNNIFRRLPQELLDMIQRWVKDIEMLKDLNSAFEQPENSNELYGFYHSFYVSNSSILKLYRENFPRAKPSRPASMAMA